ncbi:MAG: hypothetical protein JWP36_1728 [Paucimonas sp.]|nr:hypothetical protein [Paucimonas sp.]
MENAVIGVFDDYTHARDAADALIAAGFRTWAVQVTPTEESHEARQTALDDRHRYASSEGWSIGNFFRSLFGVDSDHEHAHSYSEALRRGSFLVTVEAEGEDQMNHARDVLGQFHPVDIEERAAHWRSHGWSRYEPHSGPLTPEEIQAERSRHAAQASSTEGSGQRGNAAVRSFQRIRGGASPGGGSDIGGMSGGGISGDQPAVRADMAPGISDTTGAGGSGLLAGSDSLTGDTSVSGADQLQRQASQGAGMPRTGSMSDMAAMSGGPGSGMGTGSGSGTSASSMGMGGADMGSANMGSTNMGSTGIGSNGTVSNGTGTSGMGGSSMGSSSLGGDSASRSGMTTGSSAADAQLSAHAQSGAGSSQQQPGMGEGAGYGSDKTSVATGSGGTLGSVTADNADLHESAMPGVTGSQARMGDSDMGSNIGADGTPAGSLGTPGASTGMAANDVRSNVRDQVMAEPPRDTAHFTHHETSGTMSNAAMRDSTAPDIYTLDSDADYRTHWQKSAHMLEGRYEDFAPAYRFGADLRNNDTLKGYHSWNEVEPEARRNWESGNEGSAWEKAKEAVRFGWESLKK